MERLRASIEELQSKVRRLESKAAEYAAQIEVAISEFKQIAIMRRRLRQYDSPSDWHIGATAIARAEEAIEIVKATKKRGVKNFDDLDRDMATCQDSLRRR